MAQLSAQQEPNSQQQQPLQSHQTHTQHASHLSTILHQHPSYQQQPNPNIPYDRSYLDTLSDSPSLSFLPAHSTEPFNPNSLLRDQSKSFSLSSDDSAQFRAPPGFTTSRVGGRPTQNGLSPLDDGHAAMFSGDIYSSQQTPQGVIGLDRFEGDKAFMASLRNNSAVGSGAGPYGTGSTLPESQQVSVNKVLQHQQAQAMHQQQQQQQQQAQMQQQQFQAQQLAILNSLSANPNSTSRDYLSVLQQVQNAQQLAAQLNGQPNLLANAASLLPGLQGLGNLAGTTASAPTNQEEISTIFVVGFPDDMQEREFQNMFTFCPGFEAATLKVPSKETPAFPSTGASTAAQAAATALRNAGLFPPGQNGFNGSSDPYNLLTTNSGGVVLDSRELSSNVASIWNGLANGSAEDAYRAFNLPAGTDLSILAPPAPRKQIIGFAKFRTRQEALDAREVLQGRRVDMEKGSMLKAEMAKKNLHTKRGVGPVNGNGGSASTQNPLSLLNADTLLAGLTAQQISGLAALHQAQQQQQQQPQQQQQSQQQAAGPGPIGESISQRERDSAALHAMGLNGVPQLRDREREKDRDREKDLENQVRNRIGSVSLNAYDAFHSVPANASLPARPTTFPALPPTGSATLTPGITPAIPASANGQNGGYDPTPGGRHGHGSHSNGHHAPGFGRDSGDEHHPRWGTFGTSVDPLDTSSGLGPGPTSAVGGPTSNGLHPPSSSGSLSRKASSLLNTSSPEALSPYLNMNGSSSTISPINGSGSLDQVSQYSPAVPSSQPSGMSSPLGQNGHTMYAVNGSHAGLGLGQPPSSKGSSGSASPPEKYLPQSQGSFDQFSHSPSASSANPYDTNEIARAMANLNVGPPGEMTSPPLPSPGATSGSRPNAADQNPPINTLYVGNLPSNSQAHPNTLEDSLRALFSRCPGYRKLCFRQKSNGPMCFVEFDDVPCATKALNDLYGHTLNGLVKGGIRLSFSKNPLGVRTPSVSTGPNSLAASANLFSAALAGLGDSRFAQNHLLPTRHASLSGTSFASPADVPLPRSSRQDSIDMLSPTSFGSIGFNSRAFSPPGGGAPPPQTRGLGATSSFSSQVPSTLTQSIIEGLGQHSLGGYGGPGSSSSVMDMRDTHANLSTPTHGNPAAISPAPQEA